MFGRSAVLGCTVVIAALAACGGGRTELPSTETPATATPAPAPATADTQAPAGEPAGDAGSSAGGEHTNATPKVRPTTMASDLTALGLDPKNLPPLGKLSESDLRKVMKSFSKALGVKCTKCHKGDDFDAPTKNKKIASMMWDLYVRGLTMADGGPVYCDTCHNGKAEFLDRSDDKALGHWMHENFVDPMKRVDGKEHSCETCHGKPFQPEFLSSWAH